MALATLAVAIAALCSISFSDNESDAGLAASGKSSATKNEPDKLTVSSAEPAHQNHAELGPSTFRRTENAKADGLLRALLNSSHPYPELLALHRSGEPAGYAVVRSLVRECSSARLSSTRAVRRGLLNGNMAPIPIGGGSESEPASPVVHAERIKAQQEIATRCAPILQDERLMQPHGSDKPGETLHKAWIDDRPTSNMERVLEILQQQGAPITETSARLYVLRKNREELAAEFDDLQLEGLQYLAKYSAQYNPMAPGSSLEALSLCVAFGMCAKRPEELDLTYYALLPGSPQRARALELVPKVRAMFRM